VLIGEAGVTLGGDADVPLAGIAADTRAAIAPHSAGYFELQHGGGSERPLLNGEPVRYAAQLIHGDRLQIGRNPIRFVGQGHEPLVATTRAVIQPGDAKSTIGAGHDPNQTFVVEPELDGAEYDIIPDRIEAGTFLLAGAITRGEVCVKNARIEDLTAVLHVLRQAGLTISAEDDAVRVRKNGGFHCVDVTTLPYPDSFMIGETALSRRNMDLRFPSTTPSQCSMGISSSEMYFGKPPALWTRMSRRPARW